MMESITIALPDRTEVLVIRDVDGVYKANVRGLGASGAVHIWIPVDIIGGSYKVRRGPDLVQHVEPSNPFDTDNTEGTEATE